MARSGRSSRPAVGPLRIRKLADKSGTERVVRFHPITGDRMLVNPDNHANVNDVADAPNWTHEPWPLAGVEVESAPQRVHLPTGFVEQGIDQGWIETEGASDPIVRPAGPSQAVLNSSVNGQPHIFVHYDAIVIKALSGDVRYRVVKQPDKYVDSDDPSEKVTPELYAEGKTRVDNFYDCELEG